MRREIALPLLIILAGACKGEKQPAPPAEAVAPASNSPVQLAEEAARVANAIEALPSSADSILKAAGQTPESFQQLMYRIAADSAMSEAYAAARLK